MIDALVSAERIGTAELVEVDRSGVRVRTAPRTDFWQRTYYGFRNDNAPALLLPVSRNSTFTVRASFEYRRRFDQAGVIVFINSDNWAKASIEYEDRDRSRLGSVVTNSGYSDWATRDIPSTAAMWYRLSQRGPDFLLECSSDGSHWEQMRVFHLHELGGTSQQMGRQSPDQVRPAEVRLGVYACSPEDSSFEARFEHFDLQPSLWQPHE